MYATCVDAHLNRRLTPTGANLPEDVQVNQEDLKSELPGWRVPHQLATNEHTTVYIQNVFRRATNIGREGAPENRSKCLKLRLMGCSRRLVVAERWESVEIQTVLAVCGKDVRVEEYEWYERG